MPLIPIPPNPTRADLRAARQSLVMMKTAGVPGAKDELAALDTLIRRLYPKVAAVVDAAGKPSGQAPVPGVVTVRPAVYDADGVLVEEASTRRRGRRKKRRLIDAALDCLGRCPLCRGCGKAGRTGVAAGVQCERCAGTGRAPVAVGERPRSENFNGVGRPMRGEVVAHKTLSAYQPLPPRGHDSYEANVYAELRALRRLGEVMEGAERGPKGRRLLGSRREAPLTDGQTKRAPIARRLARYQAEADRASGRVRVGKAEGYDAAAFEKTLRTLGLSDDQVRAAVLMATATQEDAGIAEARRRGDLPPDDLLEQPRVDWMVRAYDGVVGQVESQRLDSALVARPGGRLERVKRPVVVRLADGSVECYAAEDIAVVSQ